MCYWHSTKECAQRPRVRVLSFLVCYLILKQSPGLWWVVLRWWGGNWGMVQWRLSHLLMVRPAPPWLVALWSLCPTTIFYRVEAFSLLTSVPNSFAALVTNPSALVPCAQQLLPWGSGPASPRFRSWSVVSHCLNYESWTWTWPRPTYQPHHHLPFLTSELSSVAAPSSLPPFENQLDLWHLTGTCLPPPLWSGFPLNSPDICSVYLHWRFLHFAVTPFPPAFVSWEQGSCDLIKIPIK